MPSKGHTTVEGHCRGNVVGQQVVVWIVGKKRAWHLEEAMRTHELFFKSKSASANRAFARVYHVDKRIDVSLYDLLHIFLGVRNIRGHASCDALYLEQNLF